jgi:intracellular septation protein
MSEPTPPRPANRPASAPNASPQQLLTDLGPTALFVISYNLFERFAQTKDNAVYLATGLFIATTLAAILFAWLKTRHIPPVLIVTGIIVTAFGGLTIVMHDENFVKLKPTFANAFYSLAIALSLIARQNVWKLMFGHIFTLPDRIWNVLAWRWAGFFACAAVGNEIIRRSMDTGGWVTWHFPILYGATLLFAIANAPLVMKHMPPEEPAATSAP